MKLGAIISRGSRRDFVDLYLLCRELPLAELLERSGGKFGHVRDFPLQAMKGLADLSETTGEAMPRLAARVGWDEVTAWLDAELRRFGGTGGGGGAGGGGAGRRSRAPPSAGGGGRGAPRAGAAPGTAGAPALRVGRGL